MHNTYGHHWMWRVIAALGALALLASACGNDDDSEAEPPAASQDEDSDASSDSAGTGDATGDTADDADETEADADEGADQSAGQSSDGSGDSTGTGDAADDSLEPVKVGFIVQEEELVAFPELRGMGTAAEGYLNAELGGVGGHPVEIVFCGAGDAPESSIACAQEFANDDSIHLVLMGTFNTEAAMPTLVDRGKAVLPFNNLFVEMLTPGSYTFEAGSIGLIQAVFPHARDNLGATSATLLIADDPSFAEFTPVLEQFGEATGVVINEVIPIGFEADLLGTMSAANTDNDVWILAVASGDQCAAAGRAAGAIGFEGTLLASDICVTKANVESGDIDGLNAMMLNSVPLTSELGGVEAQRIIDTYGVGDVERFGTAGYALVHLQVARDVLELAGGIDATDESVNEALATYASDDLIGAEGGVSCPGPDPFIGACGPNVMVAEVADGSLTAISDWIATDYDSLAALLG